MGSQPAQARARQRGGSALLAALVPAGARLAIVLRAEPYTRVSWVAPAPAAPARHASRPAAHLQLDVVRQAGAPGRQPRRQRQAVLCRRGDKRPMGMERGVVSRCQAVGTAGTRWRARSAAAANVPAPRSLPRRSFLSKVGASQRLQGLQGLRGPRAPATLRRCSGRRAPPGAHLPRMAARC